jgi:hypothetical protein
MAGPFGPDLDFSSLAQLPRVWQQGQERAKQARFEEARKEALTLANLGQGGEGFGNGINALASIGDLEGAGKLAAIQKSIAPETSAEMQAYGMARRQGYQGTMLDFMKEKAAAGATRVSNNTTVQSGEKEYDKALNKEQADVFLGYQKGGRNAANAQNTLDLMEGLTKDPRFYSGTGGELVTRAKQAGASVGLVDKDAAGPNEMFKSLGNKLVIDAAGGSLGSQISNADVGFIRDTVPNIANTPEGNRQIIGVQRKLYQRQQEVAKMARDYASKNGGRLDYKFDEMLAEHAQKNPLFPQGAKTGPAKTGPAQQQPRQAPDGNYYVPDPNRPGKYLRVVQ